MINLLGKVPQKIGVAVSGGIDSMVALDFLLKGKRDIIVVHVNHGTEHSPYALEFVKEQSMYRGLEFCTNVDGKYDFHVSNNKEETWRNLRYTFLESFNIPIVTAHHLDDCLETWLFSTFNGKPKTIQYNRANVIRPFLLTKKQAIVDYANTHEVEYINDPSNNDCNYMRNQIRHSIVPEVLKVNPGIHKMIYRMVKDRYDRIHRTA